MSKKVYWDYALGKDEYVLPDKCEPGGYNIPVLYEDKKFVIEQMRDAEKWWTEQNKVDGVKNPKVKGRLIKVTIEEM